MKKTILLFASLLFILCGCATAKEPEQKFVATAYTQEYLNDGIVTGTDHYSYTYNDQGLIAVKTILNKDDSIAAQWSYTYNEKGDVIKEDNGNYGYTYTYVYGETIIQEQHPFGSWGSTEVPVRRTMDLNRSAVFNELFIEYMMFPSDEEEW